jgi:hypothetical protein
MLLPVVDLNLELILSIKDADLGISGAASIAGRLQLL